MVSFPYAIGFDIYNKSPQSIRNILGLLTFPFPRYFMLGRGFHEKLKFLMESEKWSYERLTKFQEIKFKQLVEHSYKNVPYYHELFKKNNLYPIDIKKIEDLKKIPILNKEDIRNNYNRLIANNAKEFKPGLSHTSGSTGRPLEFLLDQQNREIEYASTWRQAFWGGIKDVNAKIATFRGDMVFEYGKTNKLYRYNGLNKELVFNSAILDKKSTISMIRKLNAYKPKLIKGFPHSLYIIAKYIKENNIELKISPSIIQTSSEQLNSKMVNIIENVFNSRVFDWYGQSEYVISMGQCEKGNYHQTMETGLLEAIEDEYGYERICGTGLWNYSMPFIRYDIGDMIKIGKKEKKCKCEKNLLSIQSIEGRVNDMIILGEKIISGSGLDHYWKHRILNKLHIIPEYTHFIQEKLDKISIDIYSENFLSKYDEEVIIGELKLLFGYDVTIVFNYLNSLPVGKKWRFVESRVKL